MLIAVPRYYLSPLVTPGRVIYGLLGPAGVPLANGLPVGNSNTGPVTGADQRVGAAIT